MRLELWRLGLIAGIPTLYVLDLLWNCRSIGVSDYDQYLVFNELQYWNAYLFGLAKQWTPLLCGGLSTAGEPQIPFASLTMLSSYALGPLPGIVAGILGFLAIGWFGAYLYAGLWLVEIRQRCLAASLYIGNGFFICRLGHGHIDFLPFLSLPLALWSVDRISLPAASMTSVERVLSTALLGCLFTVTIDGSPVSIIHLLVWIGLYALCLSWVRRAVAPLLVFTVACAIAAFLDAGYLWPMLNAQADFPRRTADSFTGPWALLYFMIVPHRGKILPSNGTGIELSVFIGPFFALLIWRYRALLSQAIPTEMRLPLLVTSLISILLGMGSLQSVHVPAWLSPFDWLRPLPGFRSINVTGRYWGFLALPLSLLGAAALNHYAATTTPGRNRTLFLTALVLTELIFEAQTVQSAWSHSREYVPPSLQGIYAGGIQRVDRVYVQEAAHYPGHKHHHQGEFISPVRAVVNCYDMDDFNRAPIEPGDDLIKEVQLFSHTSAEPRTLEAGFVGWSHIRVQPLRGQEDTTASAAPEDRMRITLNQSFHVNWSSSVCQLSAGRQGNLVADCPASALRSGAIDLTFSDPMSVLGCRISIISVWVLGSCLVPLALFSLITRRRIAINT